jgi:hypothetical protein
MAKHSSIVGGSNAGRLLNCPASHQTTLLLPPLIEGVSSEYAEEGTFAHAVMEALMDARRQGITPEGLHGVARSWVAREFHDRTLTYQHLDELVLPALESLATLEAEYGGGFEVAGIEQKVKFPRVTGAFGTIDLVLQSNTHVLHVDWKFGAGVPVRMVYDDGEGAVLNPQITFYCAAALATKRTWYAGGRTIVGAVIQPRCEEPLTHTVISRKELRYFVEDMENAVQAAIGRDPPRKRGEWCRWAVCQSVCPAWTGPALDLSKLRPPPQRELNVTPHRVSAYGEYLAVAKALVDSLAMFKGTIDEQLHTYLEQGGKVPGWRLKAKAKMRQWIDEQTVHKELRELGFDTTEIFTTKLQTFQSIDATAKRKGVKVPEHLRVAPASTETTIATDNDPAPVVEPARLIEQFSASLKLLKQEKTAPSPAGNR